MKKIAAILIALAAGLTPGIAGAEAVGQFTDHRDIGGPKYPGSAIYDAKTGTYRVTGGGGNMWTDHDAFQFVYKKTNGGDIAMSTDLVFSSPSPLPTAGGYIHRKGGLIIRQDLDPDSAYVDALRMGNQQLSLQYREVKGGLTRLIWINTPYQERVKLERIGDYVYLSVPDKNGKLYHAGGSFKIKLTGPYYIGLGVCAHDNNAHETVDFKNVKIETLAPKAGKPVLESTLQTADIKAPQEQTVVYQTVGAIEAPVWSADGKSVLYTSGGTAFAVPVNGGEPAKANDEARKSNTDYDISPDGQWIYFNAPDAQGGMKLWRSHPNGSAKMQITSNADTRDWFPHPSPDGKWIAYLSYGADASAKSVNGKPPAHTDAELRVIPVTSGTPQPEKSVLIATLFGGEGSFDRPSWSPDSAHVAFASYRLARN